MSGPDGQVRRIVVVDDHGLLAQSLVFGLRGYGLTADVCGELTEQAILEAATRPPAGVVLLDLDLGDELGTSLF